MKLYAAGPELSELADCLAQGLGDGAVVEGDPFATAEGRAGLAALAAPERLIFVELGAHGLGVIGALGAAARSLVVRVPIGAEWLKTLRECKAAGVATNATDCATALDAHAAASAGAAWISPAAALGMAPVDVIRKMNALLKADDLPARVLAGPVHMFNALAGLAFARAHAVFATPAVLREIAARGRATRETPVTDAPKPAA